MVPTCSYVCLLQKDSELQSSERCGWSFVFYVFLPCTSMGHLTNNFKQVQKWRKHWGRNTFVLRWADFSYSTFFRCFAFELIVLNFVSWIIFWIGSLQDPSLFWFVVFVRQGVSGDMHLLANGFLLWSMSSLYGLSRTFSFLSTFRSRLLQQRSTCLIFSFRVMGNMINLKVTLNTEEGTRLDEYWP